MHRLGAGLARQPRQCLAGFAAAQDEPAAQGPQPRVECRDPQAEPPARGGADGLGLGVEDEDGDDRAVTGQGRRQRGMIAEAEVAAEPDEMRGAVHAAAPNVARRAEGEMAGGRVEHGTLRNAMVAPRLAGARAAGNRRGLRWRPIVAMVAVDAGPRRSWRGTPEGPMSPATAYLILSAAIMAEIVAATALARRDGSIWLGPRWPWAWYGLRLDAAAVVGMAFIMVGVVLVSGFSGAVPHR